jgi:hypothetical protein
MASDYRRHKKRSPGLSRGCKSLIAVNTVRHLLREEKQGTNALRRIIQKQV